MNDFADFYNTKIKPGASDFVNTKLATLKGSLQYIVFATLIIGIIFALVMGGSLIGLCKLVDFPTVCNMNPAYRKTFIFFMMMSLLFWGLYYITITNQTSILEQVNPGKFLSESVQSNMKQLELTSQQLFIVANIFSIPIYFVFILVITKLISKALNLAGLKLF